MTESDPEMRAWAEDRDRVFPRAWQFLGTEHFPAQAGSARPHTLLPGLLDEPLLFTRDTEGQLHALSNACTHRGALVCSEATQSRELRCPFHGRRFGLDGRLRAAPGFEDTPDFPTERDNLPHASLGAWGPLNFCALEPTVPFSEWIGDASKLFDWLNGEEFVHDPSGSRSLPLQAHWALYVENYLEGFHVPFVHPALSRVLDLDRYTTEVLPHGVLQTAEAGAEDAAFEPPPGHPHHGRRVAAWYLWLFPNLMLNVYPWGLSLNVVEPRGAAESMIRYHRFVRRPELLERGAGAGLDQVESEDQAVVASVQRGSRARLWRGGRLHPARECGLPHFQSLLTAARAVAPTRRR